MIKLTLTALFAFLMHEWILISNKKAGFEMLFPSEVSRREDSLKVEIGMAYTTTISSSLGSGLDARIFLANHTLYPEFMDMEKDSTGYYLSETIIEQIKNQLFNSNILYNTPSKINGMPAQFCTIQYGDDQSLVRMAIIMYKNSVMTLQYFSPPEIGISRDAEKFFNSYKRI